MKRTSAGLLLVVALLVSDAAWADSPTTTDSTTSKKSFELFGKTFCLSDAPASTGCDWRFPPKVQPEGTFDLLGRRYCFGDAVLRPDCDQAIGSVRAGTRTQRYEPWVMSLFGFDFCFGEVEAPRTCDLRIPTQPVPEQQARL